MFASSQVVARIARTKEVTAPFTMQNVHTTLLMLGNRFGGMHVDVRSSVSETLLTISSYKRGLAPVQLINHTKHQMIQYGEKGQGTVTRFGFVISQKFQLLKLVLAISGYFFGRIRWNISAETLTIQSKKGLKIGHFWPKYGYLTF